jgi:glycerol-3-phosphate dehydrogenase
MAIIGGGINGCGIARDAAGRGLSVYLCEMNDLASGTSSWSTKLIHGGLRYLEHYEFRLVREALIEREILWGIAPHLIRPLRFVLPYHKGLRPAWLLRLGLFLYDNLGGRKRLPGTTTLNLITDPAGVPLRRGQFSKGFEYSDCFVDDARLVALNAMDAAERGATIATRTRAVRATRKDGVWALEVVDARGVRSIVHARSLVNAAGPWVGQVLADSIGVRAKAKVRLVQGSHIVVRKLFDHDRAYILQNRDGRIIFAIPFQDAFTLIGTTDRDYTGNPSQVRATADEIAYLCSAISEDFAVPVKPADVVWSYSGVRPLYDDGARDAKAATRDYVFELDYGHDAPPLLSIFGGKITTYRRLAEEALERLAPCLPSDAADKLASKAGWTARAALPGGDFAATAFAALEQDLRARYPFLSQSFAERLVSAYGTRAVGVLGDARRMDDLGRSFGATLTEAEVRYLQTSEWAQSADDIVWRRSKLGLHMRSAEVQALQAWIDASPLHARR